MAWEMHKKYVEPHRCDTPRTYNALSADIHKGDIIKCGCGKLWECISEKHFSDQREGSSWTTLEYKALVVDISLYAPGTK